jgi:hypothetical protein
MKLPVPNRATLLANTRLAERRVFLKQPLVVSLSTTFRCADQDRETSPGLVRGPFVMTWIPPGGGPYRLGAGP